MTDEPRTPDSRRGLETAAVVLGLARPMVDADAGLTADQLRWIAGRLVESLAEVLRIAVGRRGPTAEWGGGDEHDAPTPSITRP
ncbi:hypothetical protein E4N62_17435 [Streptomyces sp. MNU76]|uniref:hypothetical protein n=1 Tax=Streptomyces sp. MNU76 TaxID=2560026 RepID=UPI001E4531D3|nr:hypothetical protein [Streptomyces sp. MNU76]MCC9706891.1 hypothetical protein [Streptomyces sp. MNU76]